MNNNLNKPITRNIMLNKIKNKKYKVDKMVMVQ